MTRPLSGRLARRLVQLYVGLVLYGFGIALQIRAGLGLDPWDVLHQGIWRHTPVSFGTVVIAVSALVLLLWVPLRQRPGFGTLSNAVVIGLVVDGGLAVLPAPSGLALRWVLLVSGVLVGGVATGCYIGAGLGPGPRDGLMTGLVARTGRSVRLVRTSIEVTVLLLGFLLGGSVGIGTVIYALAIGPLAHVFLPLLSIDAPSAARRERQFRGTAGTRRDGGDSRVSQRVLASRRSAKVSSSKTSEAI